MAEIVAEAAVGVEVEVEVVDPTSRIASLCANRISLRLADRLLRSRLFNLRRMSNLCPHPRRLSE